ncbi:MAG: ATP-binding protein [Candidatus Limnocylindria bacterium]
MRFTVLGELRVIARSEIILSRPAHRRLLSLLLLEADRGVETDVLIDRFWGEEPPETAKAALQTYVSQLRRLLGERMIVTLDSRYRLDLRGHHLDSQVFAAFASAAHTALTSGAWEEVLMHAERALALWHGPPFGELRDGAFALAEIARLEELRIELVEMRAEALLAIGRTEEALPDLERFVVEQPLRERLREHLMVARARLGRTSEALETYHELRDALDELGLEPGPRLRDLEERILQEDPVLVPPRVRNNLPARRTTFVGRSAELEELLGLLATTRLLTLTGVGGTGKTRLAIELAQGTLADHPDGVHFVSLAALADPDLVAHDVAEAIGLRSEDRSADDVLRASLANRRVLIVLDNCEHLLDACAQVAATLLDAGSGVRVMATSREPLGVEGETLYAVPPLSMPADDARIDGLTGSDAVRLFTDRAALVVRGFSLTETNGRVIGDICRRLDGLPLAIELAAARTRSLTIDTIAARLHDRFALLRGGSRTAPPRHQTLRATIDWSYQLLDDEERSLFERLSIFAGGCTLEGAEAVCADGSLERSRILEVLTRLIDRSLLKLVLGASGDARYVMLETIHEFTRDQLGEAGATPLRNRHREWFATIAGEAVPRLDESEQLRWLDTIHAERDNMAAALAAARAAGRDVEAANLAEALGWYRAKQGQFRRAVDLMRLALGHVGGADDPEREAALRVRLAGTLYTTGSSDALPEAMRATAALADRAPSAAKVRALTELASLHQRINQRDPEISIEAAREAIVSARAIGDRFAETHALRTLGTALAWVGEVDEGVARLRDALRVSHEIDNPTATLGVYMRLYIALLDFGEDRVEADAVAEEAIEWLDAGGNRLSGAASLLMWFAMGFMRSGKSERAEEILERSAGYQLEALPLMSHRTLLALLHWQQGRTEEASADLAVAHEAKPLFRYLRVLYPVEANVRVDEADLERARAVVERHLAADVDEVEEPTKAGSLHAIVRAEVDAALDADDGARADHRRRVESALATIRSLFDRFPPTTLAGLQVERPETALALAEAEATRLDEPAPDLWRALLDRPRYAYWRTYARCRLAESLLAIDLHAEGEAELKLARREAERIGAPILRDEIDGIARRAGVGTTTAWSGSPGTGRPDRSGP